MVDSNQKDHEARIRLLESAVIKLSEIVPGLSSDYNDLKTRVSWVERLAWVATGAYGVIAIGLEIYRTFHPLGH